MSAKTFEQLVIWKRSMDLVETIYRTTRRFPSEERSGLTATLRRTAAAIPANIADGHGRASNSDPDDPIRENVVPADATIPDPPLSRPVVLAVFPIHPELR